MVLYSQTLTPGQVVQVLDNFAGHVYISGASNAIQASLDGVTFYAYAIKPWEFTGGLKVCAPLSLWLKNTDPVNRDFNFASWH